MNSANVFVGQNTGRIRRQRRLTISELARRSGVSKATLLSIEDGAANPTIGTLESIATALEVGLSDMVENSTAASTTVRRLEGDDWNDYGDFRFRALGTVYGGDLVHVLSVIINDVGYSSDGHESGSVECVYVLSGSVLAGSQINPVLLGAGDWARYSADIPHTLRAAEGTAELILIMRRSELSVNKLPVERMAE